MAKPKPSRMTYLGGHSAWKGLLGVLAFPVDFSTEEEFTVFYTTDGDKWMQLQFPFDVASLTYLGSRKDSDKAWWLAGKRGEVVEVRAGIPRFEYIATAGTGPKNKYGYLSRIRNIGGTLFVCGYRRQVYRRDAGAWTLLSRDILDQRPRGPWNGFESIDGSAPDDVWAGGDEGELWHYDGARWQRGDSPTNCTLADVRYLNGQFWACGDGVVLRNDRNQWSVVHAGTEPAESWWSVEAYRDRIFLAGGIVLCELVDGAPEVIDTGLGTEVTSSELHCKDGLLWSIGSEHVLCFDGRKWTRLECPENR